MFSLVQVSVVKGSEGQESAPVPVPCGNGAGEPKARPARLKTKSDCDRMLIRLDTRIGMTRKRYSGVR